MTTQCESRMFRGMSEEDIQKAADRIDLLMRISAEDEPPYEKVLIRTYSELCQFGTLEDRYEYLKLNGIVGDVQFGYARYLNQVFYHSREWIDAKEHVIIRDQGNDLGVPGWRINGAIYVHHMNPVTLEQLKRNDPCLTDSEYLISCSYDTHQAITWGSKILLPRPIVIRRPNDTCPWK